MSDFQDQLAYLRRRIAKIDKKYAADATPRRAPAAPRPEVPAPEEYLSGTEVE